MNFSIKYKVIHYRYKLWGWLSFKLGIPSYLVDFIHPSYKDMDYYDEVNTVIYQYFKDGELLYEAYLPTCNDSRELADEFLKVDTGIDIHRQQGITCHTVSPGFTS